MNQDFKYRIGGVVLLAVAGLAAWWGVWRPIESARLGAPEVTWILRIVVLIPLSAVFGLFFLLTGARLPYRDIERKTLTPVGWTLFGVIGVLSFVAYFWMRATLDQLGYR